MERRKSRRKPARVPVRFWPRGDPGEPRRGYTTDISIGGMHVATGTPFPSRTRLRLEVGSGAEAFTVEGVVVHSHRVAPELRKIGLSGMGIRFLPLEELVTELLGGLFTEEDEAGGPGPDEGFYRLRFDSPEDFLAAMRNDVAHGGLFVPTSEPAPLESAVTVEVIPPADGVAPVRLAARVVHRTEPAPPGEGPNLLSGIGVQFDDPAEARELLGPAIEAVEQGSERSS